MTTFMGIFQDIFKALCKRRLISKAEASYYYQDGKIP